MPKGKKVAFFCSYEGNFGKAFQRLEKACEGSEVLGSKDFMAPLKIDREKTLKDAEDWALSIVPTLK
jgi:flavodoxin